MGVVRTYRGWDFAILGNIIFSLLHYEVIQE